MASAISTVDAITGSKIGLSTVPDAGNAQTVLHTSGFVVGGVATPVSAMAPLPVVQPKVSPTAAAASVITTGGTAVTVVTGPISGGYIQNYLTAARQGIGAAEPLYVDMVATPGSTDAAMAGTTSAVDPGNAFTIPALATGVSFKVNAATSGHKFNAVIFQ